MKKCWISIASDTGPVGVVVVEIPNDAEEVEIRHYYLPPDEEMPEADSSIPLNTFMTPSDMKELGYHSDVDEYAESQGVKTGKGVDVGGDTKPSKD
ncbi:hypothetical protein LCGC14_1496900 [marine sediment metagenome]|uniref:Uncharacterized protein n=1 Tax=marine sediment metagenome TaxID=412755 RepID=A0A0F9J572_9ZZZZ